MTADLVSIVIICWNNWPDLELAIQSALHQSYSPVEVIVVDNGSTDATSSEVPRLFGGAVRYVRQAFVRCGAGYNTGVRLSKGEFIQLLDGDDFLAPNKIEKQVEVFRADPGVDIVYGDFRAFQSLAQSAQWKDVDVRGEADMLPFLIASDIHFSAHSLLYRRRVIERVGTWDESLYVTDRDYWLRAARAGCRFRYCAGSLCFYRVRPGQMSANLMAMMRGGEAVWDKALGYITAEPYRSMVLNKLAHVRYRLALKDRELTVRQALDKLALARAVDPATINLLAYVVGALLIVLPGSGFLLRARWMKLIRHCVSRIIGTRLEQSSE